MSTTKTRRPKGNKKSPGEGVKQTYLDNAAGATVSGEVLTWTAGNQTHTHAVVVQALKDAGLNDAIARELAPRHAFTRAAKRLTEERVIDQLREQGDEIVFQFTKRNMEEGEWKYAKDCLLILDKTTGKVSCERKELETQAQAELDRCIENRTTADITKIVQQCFKQEEDKGLELFSLRPQGGCYFVAASYISYVEQVQTFLEKLGGRLNRLPIASGTKHGDKAIQDVVESGFNSMAQEHMDAIKAFGVDTRPDTLTKMAEKIKMTRVKLQAYKAYLGDRLQQIDQALETGESTLVAKVETITQERANRPPQEGNANRITVMRHSVTAVIRWMGRQKWGKQDARRVLAAIGAGNVADATINAQLPAGRDESNPRGEPANLTEEEINQLNELRATAPEPVKE